MARIRLTQAQLATLLDYNPATGSLTWRLRDQSWFKSDRDMRAWNTRFAGKPAFATPDGEGYLMGRVFGQNCYAHRIIWKLVRGEEPEQIDHDNGRRSENWFSNLLASSPLKNNMNRGIDKRNKSGALGVCWNSSRARWSARLGRRNRYFHSLEDAISFRRKLEADAGFSPSHGRRRAHN